MSRESCHTETKGCLPTLQLVQPHPLQLPPLQHEHEHGSISDSVRARVRENGGDCRRAGISGAWVMEIRQSGDNEYGLLFMVATTRLTAKFLSRFEANEMVGKVMGRR